MTMFVCVSGKEGGNTGLPLPERWISSLVVRGLAAIAVMLLSVGGFLSLRDSGNTQPQQIVAAVEAPAKAETPRYLSKDIRDLQVMQDRVLANNPLDDEKKSLLSEIVPADWRVAVLAVSLTTKDTKDTKKPHRTAAA